jgi:hypothetical protein
LKNTILQFFNNHKKIALLCFLSDLGLSIWSYELLKNYDQYLKIVKPIVASPDFQVQIYALFLQSLIFTLMIFLAFHLIIYILFIKKLKYAVKYVRIYSAMAAISCVLMILSGYIIAFIPIFIYSLSFFTLKKNLKNNT